MSPDRPANGEHPKELISAYLDGHLDAQDRVRVFEHLRGCDACRWLLSDYRALAAAARREEAPPIPDDLAGRIGRRIGAEPAARFARRRRLVAGARLPLATAAAVLVLVSLWVVWRGRLPGERLEETPAAVIPPPPAPPAPQAPPTDGAAPALAPAPAPGPNVAGGVGISGAGVRDETGAIGPTHGGAVGSADADGSRSAEVGGSRPADALPRASRQQASREGVWREEADAGEKPKIMRQLAVPGKDDQRTRKIAPPEENPAPEGTAGGTFAAAENAPPAIQGSSPGPGLIAVGAVTGTAATASPTLVFVMPEGRVTILPGSQVVLAAGDYVCTIPASGQVEADTIGELRALAARRGPPVGAFAGTGPGSPSPPPVGEIVVPAPPATGPLPPDLAARLHLRLRALLRDYLLPRAEAQCGPPPPALRDIH